MIPSILDQQIHQGLKDFLSTTFHVTNPFFHGILERFMETEGAFAKGPYFSLNLPFKKGQHKKIFPHIDLGFTPYLHQEEAFARLSGDNPRPSIIATGTGSGKTECFALPVLEYCRRNYSSPGIKAILIYPMNALAFDQARRLAGLIWNNPELHGKIRAGLFVGSKSEEPLPRMGKHSIITDKDILRDNPPDILLTNYKMLDYLLIRAGDARLWAENAPESLRFIVVDELHTFDGAQGTDLACLLRRLKARLQTPDDFLCPVGTSATLGGGEDRKKLVEYAGQVFGQNFDQYSVIMEQRETPEDFLRGRLISRTWIPGPQETHKLSPETYNSPSEYIQAQVRLWVGEDASPAGGDEEWRVKLGRDLLEHVLFHNLLRLMDGKVYSLAEILEEFSGKTIPSGGDGKYPALLLNSLLALISEAKAVDEKRTIPFIHVRVQHWFRELRRMLCSVDHRPELRFADDLTADQRDTHLPLLHCRECGQTGWLGRRPSGANHIQTDLKRIYSDFFKKKPSPHMISFFPKKNKTEKDSFSGIKMNICPFCLYFAGPGADKCPGCGRNGLISVLVPEQFSRNCPSCGAHNSLTLLGSRAASLTSVMIGQMMASRYNTDRKCIAFSDNVQDAAHRAGFFGARTFKFTFRTALQQYVLNEGEGNNLKDLARNMPEYWQKKMDPETYAATFLPPNMAWMQEAEYLYLHDKLPSESRLCDLISRRLRFETVSEYGFSTRIGRTLEKSGASMVTPDSDIFTRTVASLSEALPNEIEELRVSDLGSFPAFLLGLITQMKNQGGIFDPDLKRYIETWGNQFMISQQKIIWMPGFGPRTRAPGFPTTRAGIERFPQLILNSNRVSWYEWWAYRHFPELVLRQPDLVRDFYDRVFRHGRKFGLFEDIIQGGHHIYGLCAAALVTTGNVLRFKCEECGYTVSGAGINRGIWEGMPCLRRGCSGKFKRCFSGPDYYGRLYSRGKVARLVAREHTGLLGREEREALEEKFKLPEEKRKPWHPNLLSSTPTLEMGIDVGDLSSTIQCSVPPAQANYVQRVGRSGRKIGNGLNLTIAAGKAHDLYFFANPKDMIDGRVAPPGVFLDASAVLERQFTAFCLDCWIRENSGDNPVPRRLGKVLDTLGQEKKHVFPHNLLTFIRSEREKLLESFKSMFSPELSSDSKRHLDKFVFGGSEENQGVEFQINSRLHQLHKERNGLKRQIDRLYREIKRREGNPAKDKNFAREMDELRRERSGLMALVRDINAKDTYNFFTEEGLLPNYAFPEQGILLKSIIYRRKLLRESKNNGFETFSFEYERPGASGLRELAPGSSFYAGGRRVKIDRVDLRVSDMESWRLCSECTHCEREQLAREKRVCPGCGSSMWTDQGRRQDLIRLNQVMASTPDWKTRIADDSEVREPIFYTTQLLVDVDDSAIRDAYQVEDPQCPFGFEFISKAVFRDINFGLGGGKDKSLRVAGEDLDGKGFLVCRHCGKVQDKNGKLEHAFGCPARNKESDSNFVKSVFLYREFSSEAIKILIPVAGVEASGPRIDSFVAALQLGLKLHFGGSAYAIEHLRTTLSREPVVDSASARQYLVLFDTVPGGTGFLKQLMRSDTMFEVLEKALKHLRGCSCRHDPLRDGCYNCLFAYRNSYSMPTTSRAQAEELLAMILSYRKNICQVPDLKNVRMDGLEESELERRFLKEIGNSGNINQKVRMRTEIVRGKPGRLLQIDDKVFEIEPQVEIDKSSGARVPSRADFIIRPMRAARNLKSIAVYTDGFTFHRQRIGRDTAQRMAVVYGGRFYVWSLSYKDVVQSNRKGTANLADLLHPEDSYLSKMNFDKLLGRMDLENCRDWHLLDNFDLFLRFLNCSDKNMMRRYAFAQAISLLNMPGSEDKHERHAWLEKLKLVAPDNFYGELSGMIEQVFFGGCEKGPVQIFALIGRDFLKRGDLRGMRVLCFLDDGKTALEDAGFERSWINYLRLFNIFQFLPGAVFVSRQGLNAYMYADMEDLFSDEKTGTENVSAEVDDSKWDECLELADPAARGVLNDLRSRGWPPPEVGFELSIEGRTAAEAELAWPSDEIVYLLEDQLEHASVFESQGWRVYRM